MALSINGTDGIETNTDTGKLKFGTGDDLQIYHDGTQSIIETNSSATKPLHLKGDPIWFYKTGTSELFCKMVADSGVEIYHDGSKKLESISTGINVTGGVRIGGNNAANEIDDYEEGTFTPKLAGNANNSTYSVNGTGAYTKIGNMCHVQVRFHGVDLDQNADGCVIISDMPFTGTQGASGCAAGTTSDFHTYNCVFSDDQRYTWYLSHNTDWWQGLISRNNNSWADWDIDDFNVQNVLYIDFHGVYRTV